MLFSQYYNLGQDPGSLKWRHIQTAQFNLIYPENFEPKAQQMMQTLTYANKNEPKTLAYSPNKIPFIIHSYNIDPNAVTIWAPKRVELYTCPPQDSYAQDWLDQLVLHEYRHVIQIDRTNQGFTKVLSWITGEQGTAAINGLFVPQWFMEGDAVCTETALSHSGRGRVPNFEMPLRAQVTQLGAFTYDKAALGSYKSFVPDHYVLGYSFVANIRRKYSYNAWVSALDEVAKKPFIITPFNHGLKKATGYGKESLYRTTMLDMDSLWKFQDENTTKTPFNKLTINNKRKYENYKFPFYLNDTLVVAEYSSLDVISCFKCVGPGGYTKTITTPGYLSSENYSMVVVVSGKNHPLKEKATKTTVDYMIAWTETINDFRWGERSYSVIRIYDSKTGKTRQITNKSRFFAPAFSPDGEMLAAVTVNPAGISSIVLLDVNSGKTTDTIITSKSDFYMTPSWSEDGKMIAFTKLDAYGKSIVVFNLETRVTQTIVDPTYIEIANPVFANGYILFNGSYSGIENIYAVDIKNKEISRFTSAEFGACNPRLSPDRKKIVYSNYTSGGYGLAEAEFNPTTWKSLSGIRDYSPSLYKYLVKEEGSILNSLKDSSQVFESKPYKKASHIFNFHSWAPAYINYMEGAYGGGISFMSQNELSTATTVVGYAYDMAENTGKVTLDFNWQGWYPIIDIKSSYGARAAYDSAIRYNFNETMISGGLILPLIFTGGKYYKGIQLQAYSTLCNITDNTSPYEDKLKGTINSMDYKIYVYRYIKQSYKDIYPRWGQTITFTFRHTPFGDNNYGSITSVATRFYLPGMVQHHGIRLDLNWQKRNPGSYNYSNTVNLPRGYDVSYDETIRCLAFNYKFPFAYPDFSLGPLVYFKRFKANLFYDAGVSTTHNEDRKMQSTGAEITSDLHVLRFVFPIDLGLRFGYMPIEKETFFNFLFSVNL